MFKNIAAAAALTLSASAASAVTLDFEGTGDCLGGPGVTFTLQGTTTCSAVTAPTTGSPAIGLHHATGASMRADFSAAATMVSLDMGDYNADPDNIFLEIFSSLGVSLGYVDFLRPGSSYDMDTLSLSATGIAYAIFGTNGSDLGFIAVDNFSFETAAAVPLPAGGLLLLAGLGGLAAARRRKS